MDGRVSLRPVDSVDITLLVDNAVDALLPSTEQAKRPPLSRDWVKSPQLRAEHGFSTLVTLRRDGAETNLLYDAGLSPDTLSHNLDVLGISLDDLQAIVLSHGHGDHHGGLEGLLRKVGRRRLPMILHPDAWKTRKIVFPTGAEVDLPPPDRRMLEQQDVEILEREGPSLLMGDSALVSGKVERTTEFEQGFQIHWARGASGWKQDKMIWDDQNLICHVKGKGLVVVSGCSHAGAINILRNARRITGVAPIHAFVGGLHLTGGSLELTISQTMSELEQINPAYLIPGHCSGWKAQQEIGRRLPKAFLQASVGTRYHFT
jgi:7,8-dihydropterin-6-yl-methyl-4-(beta-D-ribofuranosyl)aminobenzene 5'-phosphate synthase